MTPIIANSTTIDNQVVFATVFIGTLHACGPYYARAWAEPGGFSSTLFAERLVSAKGKGKGQKEKSNLAQTRKFSLVPCAFCLDPSQVFSACLTHWPARAAAAAGPACAPVWNVPVSGTPIGPTGM